MLFLELELKLAREYSSCVKKVQEMVSVQVNQLQCELVQNR